MENWKKIWISYHVNASRINVLKTLIKLSNTREKTFWSISFLGMVLGMVLIFMDYGNLNLLTLSVFVFEIALLRLIDNKKELFILNAVDGGTNSTMLDESDNRGTRYCLFKKSLEDNNVSKESIPDINVLIDLQIDLTTSSGLNVKKFFGFIVGILMGLLSASWKLMNTNKEFIFVAFAIFTLGVVILMLLSLFPSKLERLKEMKYFLKLYELSVQKTDLSII